MASGSLDNDWSGTVPIQHSSDECALLLEYGKERGVKIHGIKSFDGDSQLLKEQINTISSIKKEFKLKQNITIEFRDLPDGDFAESHGSVITFNRQVLRSKKISENNLYTGNFSSDRMMSISAHEMGHIISRQYGEKGIEIAHKTYYNIFREKISNFDLLLYLSTNISEYSIETLRDYGNVPFSGKQYKEVIPEIMGKYITNPDKYVLSFIALLKEAFKL